MKLLDFLKRERKKSASVAKERLQIIVAHQRTQRGQPDYMPLLEKEHPRPCKRARGRETSEEVDEPLK